jgi:peptidoglycan/LPS O-acetylase OafA/YrhL
MISTAPLPKTPPVGIRRPPVHLPFLDGLRAFAAIYVLIHHEVLQVGIEQPTLNAGGMRLICL